MSQIDQGFVELLNGGSKKDQGQGEEGGDDGSDPETGEAFRLKWGWIANVDAASETCRCSWDEVLRWSAVEFLNILSYRKDKIAKDTEEIEKWKKTH